MAADPINGLITRPATLSQYSYVVNNPYKYTDPTGMNPRETLAHYANGAGVSYVIETNYNRPPAVEITPVTPPVTSVSRAAPGGSTEQSIPRFTGRTGSFTANNAALKSTLTDYYDKVVCGTRTGIERYISSQYGIIYGLSDGLSFNLMSILDDAYGTGENIFVYDEIAFYAGQIAGNIGAVAIGGILTGGAVGGGIALSLPSGGAVIVPAYAVASYGYSTVVSGVVLVVKNDVILGMLLSEAINDASSSNAGAGGTGNGGGSSGKLTSKEATEAVEKLGYRKTNYYSHGQPVYEKVSGHGPKYITPDVDAHSGGVWKGASSVDKLASKATRLGTYSADLKWIGD